MSICLPDGRCIDPSSMKVGELKTILKKNKVDYSHVVEKSELIDLVVAHPPRKDVIKLDIVSDTMCPWCFVGKRNLETAMKQFPDVDFQINWLPFFLNPGIPDEGYTLEQYFMRNYGSTKHLEGSRVRLAEKGKQVGIDFNWQANQLVFPTIDSHRLVMWAKQFGHEKENLVIEALFHAHFEKGLPLNDYNMLCSVAEEVGLDPVACRKYLDSEENDKEIRSIDKKFKQGHRGVNGVPHYIIKREDDALVDSISGAQDPEAFVRLFSTMVARY